MKYRIEFQASDLLLLGEALDLLPHGRVQGLVARTQAQITDQDSAERDRVTAENAERLEAFRATERAKIEAEVKSAAVKPLRVKKKR